MAEIQQTPTSLCCCRKPLPVGASDRPPAGPAPGSGLGLGPGTPRGPPADVASASNFRCFQLRHLHLDLRINFAMKEMSGWTVLDLVPVRPGLRTLVLDSHPSLLIHSVDCKGPGAGPEEPVSLTYWLDPFTDYGTALSIGLPAAAAPGRPMQVTVRYSTTDGPAVSRAARGPAPPAGSLTLSLCRCGGWTPSSPVARPGRWSSPRATPSATAPSYPASTRRL